MRKILSVSAILVFLGVLLFADSGYAVKTMGKLPQKGKTKESKNEAINRLDEKKGGPGKLEGGRSVDEIYRDLVANANIPTLAEEFAEHNILGDLGFFLSTLELKAEREGADTVKALNTTIGAALQEAGLNGAEREEDIITLPASQVAKMDMKEFDNFLTSPQVAGKAVVLVSNKKGELGKVRTDFNRATGKKLEKLVWLKLMSLDTDLRVINALFDEYGLSIGSSLDKVTDKDLSALIAQGV